MHARQHADLQQHRSPSPPGANSPVAGIANVAVEETDARRPAIADLPLPDGQIIEAENLGPSPGLQAMRQRAANKLANPVMRTIIARVFSLLNRW
jgi:hypothetical protein